MEPESVESEVITGFTLELDGDPSEIARIRAAIGREMERIRWDNRRDDPMFMDLERRKKNSRFFLPFVLGRMNVRGQITIRKAII